MNTDLSFLIGIGLSLALSIAVVLYLRPHLQRILADICGTKERAGFWTAFSNVTLILVPLICAMFQEAGDGTIGSFLARRLQLKLILIGLVAAVAILGFVIGLFIPRALRPASPPAR